MAALIAFLAIAGAFVWYGPDRAKAKLLELAVTYSENDLSALVGKPLPTGVWRDAGGQARAPGDEPSRPMIVYVAAAGCSACEELGEYLAVRKGDLAHRAIEVRILMDERAQPSHLLPREWIRRLDDTPQLKKLRGLAYPTIYFLDAERRVESLQTGFSRESLQEWIDRHPATLPVGS